MAPRCLPRGPVPVGRGFVAWSRSSGRRTCPLPDPQGLARPREAGNPRERTHCFSLHGLTAGPLAPLARTLRGQCFFRRMRRRVEGAWKAGRPRPLGRRPPTSCKSNTVQSADRGIAASALVADLPGLILREPAVRAPVHVACEFLLWRSTPGGFDPGCLTRVQSAPDQTSRTETAIAEKPTFVLVFSSWTRCRRCERA